MSIYKNGKLIAGGRQTMPLLSFMWADHQLNDISWLRADTFSWQSGAVYTAVYQHLADDITGKTLQSEIVGGVTVQFYLADDGHKICPASEESNVASIFSATGVAWYYIIDTTNQRFKLPRTKFGFTGIRTGVGKYVEAGIPNITGSFYVDVYGGGGTTGAFTRDSNYNVPNHANWAAEGWRIHLDASRASSVYGNSDTVQPKATEMYLYFYVGQFTQTALENTAGITAETLNDKVDKGHQVIEYQEPTADNGYTWYRKYADGWVEQGGHIATAPASEETTVVFPVSMADTTYFATRTIEGSVNQTEWTVYAGGCVYNKTTTGMTFKLKTPVCWEVKGMAA